MKLFLAALLLAFALPAQAANTLFSTVDPQSELRNPVMVGLGFESRNARLTIAIGSNDLTSGSLDLFARSRSGLTLGVGVVADYLNDDSFESVSSSSDTLVTRPHDHGKHKGDRHVRGGKTVVLRRSYLSSFSVLGEEYGLTPSLFLGVSNPVGVFAESRVLFNGGEVSNRISVGLRW